MKLVVPKAITAALTLCLLACGGLVPSGGLQAKEDKTANPDFAAITARGRLLAEYDVAAAYSTDAVQALSPEPGSVSRYVAKKTGTGWTVAYGRFSVGGSKFLIVYEAKQGDAPEKFTVKKHDPPLEDAGFFLFAARSIELTSRDFQRENRLYNISVLPAEANQLYVYITPGQITEGIYPLGGDVRYLVSADGSRILEKRQLHKTIIDVKQEPKDGKKLAAGFHTHVISDVPEDTDVFYVLWRKPPQPEYVETTTHTYEIRLDGTIKVVK